MDNDTLYYLGFNLVPGIGPTRLDRIIAQCGSLAAAWEARPADFAAAGLGVRTAEAFGRVRRSLDLEAEYERVLAHGVDLVARGDARYPPLLAEAPGAPFLLYVRGTLLDIDRRAVAVVGTRQPTAYGREATRTLVAGLAAAGLTIVSGLALGVDTVAHEAALAAGGRTLAVLGSGVDQIYPLRNERLGRAIATHGALVSEYPLATMPTATNFPPRNRLISGLSLAVVVVEAALRSGALITASFAAEQGRDVFAVPGSIFSLRSQGTNELLRQGAAPACSADDILEALDFNTIEARREVSAAIPETLAEAALLAGLEAEPRHADELGREAGLAAADVAATFAVLELKGLARHVGGMWYVRA